MPLLSLWGEQGSVPLPSIFQHLWKTSVGLSCPQHHPWLGDPPTCAPCRWGWHSGDTALLWGTPHPLCGRWAGCSCGAWPGAGQQQGFARRVPGVCQACAPSPGHISWGWGVVSCCTPREHTRLLVKILQGFLWVWEGPGWGSAPMLACSTSSMAWHMLCCKWALCTCLGCCSLKSIAMATAPSHAVHSCCRRDKEHILKQHILNVDVLKCNF